jgi:hypothetical protein
MKFEHQISEHYQYSRDYSQNWRVWYFEVFVSFEIPIFTPDEAHIKWVKEAWGMNPKPTKPKPQEQSEYDSPIPF